jgi:hypothetical protein
MNFHHGETSMIKVKRFFSKPQSFFLFLFFSFIVSSFPHASHCLAHNDTLLFSTFDIFQQIPAAVNRSAPSRASYAGTASGSTWGWHPARSKKVRP